VEILRAILTKHLSVRQVEELAQKHSERSKRPVSGVKKKPEVPFEEKISALSQKTGTEVSVKIGRGGKGNIAVNFSSKDELERILNLLI